MYNTLKLLNSACLLVLSLVATNSNASLIDRGNGLIYDDVLNVTWLQNANFAGGKMSWDDSIAWATGLSYQGFDDWRLPTVNVTDTNGTGILDCDFSNLGDTDCGHNALTSNSELSYMFFINLGNVAFFEPITGNPFQPGYDTLNTSFTDGITGNTLSFTNLFRDNYWTGTESEGMTFAAWRFETINGFQNNSVNKNTLYYAWAVRNGDVGTASIPEPETLAIFGIGLLGLVFRRLPRKSFTY